MKGSQNTMEALTRFGIIALIVLAAIAVIGVILTRLYRRATKDVSLIRTGFGGEKVVINGGIMVIPVLHELMQVRMTTVKLEVDRTAKNALITLDKLRVDVIGLFHIKVKPVAEGVAAAAQTLGTSVNDQNAVKSLFEGKLVSALRSVAATMTMEHLHANRADFIQKVQEAVQTDLDMNGFQLESVSITHFDQTNFQHLDENNIFDAEGMTKIARETEDRKRVRNEITAENRVAIERRNLEANSQSLEIAQQAEQARLTQERTIAASRAEQQAAVAESEAASERARETARIETEKTVAVAETQREGAIKAAVIERDRTIELARIETQVATQEASERESAAAAKANEARAEAVRAEESVATAKATEVANRDKNVAVIRAEQEAQQKAVGITVQAKAEADAAELRATAIRVGAEAEALAKTIGAEADEKVNRVRAEGELAFNKATNELNEAQTSLMGRKALLEVLPAILTAAAKPMEKIDKISVIDARGIHGGAGGDDGTGAGNGNLADAAVSAAMRYRVGSPIVDALLGELGLNGGSMNALMGAAAQTDAPKPVTEAAPAVEAPVEGRRQRPARQPTEA